MKARLNSYSSTNPKAAARPVLVMVPGGGCFSAASWGPVEPLLKTFDVVTVDPPGLGGLPRPKQYDYESVISAMERELDPLTRPLVFVGHSFGATYAADLATRGKYRVVGYVGMAAPITVGSLQQIDKYPNPHHTDEMKSSEAEFLKDPTEEGWKQMLDVITPIYFTPPFYDRGKKLLLDDKSDYRGYLDIFFPYVLNKIDTDLVDRMKKFTKPKVMVAGGADHLVPAELIKKDAETLGAKFELVESAPHFILYEQPEKTLALFEKYFLEN